MTEGLRLRLYYTLAGALAWLAYRVLGLRRSVVRGNLQRSFPEWSAEQQRAARREFARRQGELTAEVFYAEHIDEAELRARVTLVNPQVVAAAAAPRPVILVGAHHGNFEWMVLRMSLEFGDRLIGLYKPLRQPPIDRRMKAMRSRFGARLVPAKSILRELANFREAAAIGLVADQVPRTSPEKHWVNVSRAGHPLLHGAGTARARAALAGRAGEDATSRTRALRTRVRAPERARREVAERRDHLALRARA